MEVEKNKKVNDNGSYTEKVVKIQNPDDGFARKSVMRPNAVGKRGKHKGYAKSIQFSTNNPKITRPIAYGIYGIFILIGILTAIFLNRIMGICFIVVGIIGIVDAKKDIDKIEEELKKK